MLRLGDHGDGHVADEYASLQSVFRIKFAQDVTHLFGRRPVVRNDVNGQSFGFERLFVGCHLGPAVITAKELDPCMEGFSNVCDRPGAAESSRTPASRTKNGFL